MSLMILSHEKEATIDPNFTIMTKLEKSDIFIHDYIIMTEFEKDFDISTESADRLQLLTDMILASENTSGIHSPVASSTLGTPMKRYQISDLMYMYLQER